MPASASCVRITPDVTNTFEEDDDLPDGRVMGNFILLPNGKIFLVNGVNQGVAGYGNDVGRYMNLRDNFIAYTKNL